MIGKSLPHKTVAWLVPRPRGLLTLVLFRLIFVPLYWIGNVENLPEVYFVLLTLAFGISNGYLTTAAFLQYPQLLASRGLDTIHGANMMTAALMLGLCMGAFVE